MGFISECLRFRPSEPTGAVADKHGAQVSLALVLQFSFAHPRTRFIERSLDDVSNARARDHACDACVRRQN